jgi:hypothetical protein
VNKFLLACIAWLCLASIAHAGGKVLYVTHEPGRWHDYTAQLGAFRELASIAGWELTVATGDVDALMAFLRTPHFAAGQGAIVYNFCLADSRDLTAMTNLMAQTEQQGVPALLVHCAMHSWWDTFKKGREIPGNELGTARAHRKVLKQWQQTHPDTPFPAWGDFTGVASTRHGPKKPIVLDGQAGHPTTASIPNGYSTGKTELYNNHYVTRDVAPLVIGRQGKDEAIVMWQAPRGNGQIIGLTLGHADEEWTDPVFLAMLRDAVNYLLTPAPAE